ncbi:hypothetical protein [Pseudolysinimonas sp.]|uniref:hypothetical protein n=1 Tax=Pseudolysinimonas sp. TaxID=2680009 RepID=UPI003F7CF600
MKDVTELSRPLANGPIDRKLLAGAADGLSPRELSRLVGGIVTPEEAAQRVRDLLESRNWLTFFEQEQLALESINEMLTMLRTMANAGSLDAVKVSLSAIKLKLDTLAKNRISPEQAANIIREGQARIMLSAIQMAMLEASRTLASQYGVEPTEVRETVMLALPAAVETVEARIEQS